MKTMPDYYPAPAMRPNAVGVRVVDVGISLVVVAEVVKYEGTREALASGGIVPPEIFDAVGDSGEKTARLVHPGGRSEVIRVMRGTTDGLWQVVREHLPV